MEFTADYLANCRRFGVTSSGDDFAEYLAEAEADGPDDSYDEED